MAIPSDDAASILKGVTDQATGGDVTALDLAASTVQPEGVAPLDDAPVTDPPAPVGPMPTTEDKPVQVAGLKETVFGLGAKIGSKMAARSLEAEKRVFRPQIRPGGVVQMGDVMVIRPVEGEEALRSFEALTQGVKGMDKGLNIPRVADELQLPSIGQYMEKVKELNLDLFQHWSNPRSMDEIIDKAMEKGADQHLIEWLTRSKVTGVSAEEAVGGYVAWIGLAQETKQQFEKVLAITDPVLREKEMMRPQAMLSMLAELGAKVSGGYSEAARTTMAAGQLKKLFGYDIGEMTQSIESMMSNPMSMQDFDYLAQAFVKMPNAKAQQTFIEQGFYAKTMDKLAEVYVNSILSGAPTHIKNIMGNATMITTRMLETGSAALIGKARGNEDRYESADVIAQLHGIKDGFWDAVYVAGKAFVKEESQDLTSKIDTRNRRAIGTTGDPAQIWQQIREGDVSAALINTLGTYYRMQGRFMLAEDEFFKAINKRIFLSETSERSYREMYGLAIEQGKTEEEAIKLAQAERSRIYDNRTLTVDAEANDYAQKMVFQGPMPGKLARLDAVMSSPEMKIFGVTFFRTPYHISSAVMERTPVVGMLHPNFIAAMKNGGREADMAWAKQLTGVGLFGMAAWGGTGLESDGVVTVNGTASPSDPEARKALQRTGRPGCSLTINMGDGSKRSYAINGVADPASALVCMAADYRYFAQYESDGNVLSDLVTSATAGLWGYQLEQPYLQSLKDFMPILQAKNPKDAVNMIERYIAEKGTTALLQVVPTNSSFSASIARTEDNTSKNTMQPDVGLFGEDTTQLPEMVRGFYTALQKAKARNPFFSDKVPPALNVWGEKMTATDAEGWDWINPIRIKDVKYAPVDKELVRIGGISEFDKKINGIELTASQFNRWVEMTNQMDRAGKMPGDPGYRPETALLGTLLEHVENQAYLKIPTKDLQRKDMQNLVSERRSAARDMLMKQFPDLEAKVLRGKQ